MSLSALSTELDIRIIDFLESSDLSRYSRVTKYYRKLCEERLYADIELEGSSPRRSDPS
jgi:hypothetical protein